MGQLDSIFAKSLNLPPRDAPRIVKTDIHSKFDEI
jgi:hypothetical protein